MEPTGKGRFLTMAYCLPILYTMPLHRCLPSVGIRVGLGELACLKHEYYYLSFFQNTNFINTQKDKLPWEVNK